MYIGWARVKLPWGGGYLLGALLPRPPKQTLLMSLMYLYSYGVSTDMYTKELSKGEYMDIPVLTYYMYVFNRYVLPMF